MTTRATAPGVLARWVRTPDGWAGVRLGRPGERRARHGAGARRAAAGCEPVALRPVAAPYSDEVLLDA